MMKPIYFVFSIVMLLGFQVSAQKLYIQVDINVQFHDCVDPSSFYLNLNVANSRGESIGGYSTPGYSSRLLNKKFVSEIDLTDDFSGSIYFFSYPSYKYQTSDCFGTGTINYEENFSFPVNTCITQTIEKNGTEFSLNATVKFFRGPKAPEASQIICGTNRITLTATDAVSNVDWQVSENGTTWQTFLLQYPQVISVRPEDLHRDGFITSKYANCFFRVKASTDGCGSAQFGSSTAAFKFYAPPPTVTYTTTPPTCHDGIDGAVTLSISSAEPQINNFLVTTFKGAYPNKTIVDQKECSFAFIATPLSANTEYWIRIQNNTSIGTYGSCFYDIQFIPPLTNPDPITLTLQPSVYNGYNIKCKNGNDGSLQVTPSGGIGPYNYTWTPNVSTSNIAPGLLAQTYMVKVKDAKGCLSADYSKTLTEPSAVSTTLSSTGGKGGYDVSCWNKTDGLIESLTTGGVRGYTYLWSNNSTASVLSGIGTGNYILTVTDANGCKDTKNKILSAPLPINFNIGQITGLTCATEKTASLEAQGIENAIGSIKYLWSSGEVTPGITNKGSGSYSLTVSDGQGCSTSKSAIVKAPPAHTVSIATQSNFNGSPIRCNGESNGEIVAVVKDANNNIVQPNYYTWFKNGLRYEEGTEKKVITDLAEAQYLVEITYDTKCKTQSSLLFLNDPNPISANITVTTNYNGQPISCSGKSDANLKANPTGGTGGTLAYTYEWNTGNTTSTLTGVGAGDYLVKVTDKNKCPGEGTLLVQDPDPVMSKILLFSNYGGYGISCNGSTNGSITAGGDGGTGTYNYVWSNGKTTPAINSLAAGDYTVSVTDNNGCQSSSTVHTINAPPVLTVQVNNKQNVSCYNGADGFIVLTPNGGAGAYEYSKNSTTWQASPKIDVLPIGTYKLYVKDGNGCSNSIEESLTQPSQIQISFESIEPAFCSDPVGKATSVVTGGVNSYRYEWKKEGQDQVEGTGITLLNASAGVYRLFVKDGNNCPAENIVAITSTDGAKSNYSSTDAKCFDSSDGSALITITSGYGPFVIQWPDGQSSLQGINLKRSTYNVSIKDINNCIVIQPVEIKSPDALQLAKKNETIPTCNGFCNGQITLEGYGGIGEYVYEWNSNTGASQNQLCAGIYPVNLRDGNNCLLIQNVELLQPDKISATVIKETLSTCTDDCDGALEIAATGGNGNYQYAWNEGGNTPIKNNLCPGIHKLNITDEMGCIGEVTVALNNTPLPPVDLGGGVTLCVGQEYSLDAGNNWKYIKWQGSNGLSSTKQQVTVKDPGQYWLEVLNDKGCVGRDTFLLETSIDLLKANFILTTEARVGDTIVIIDISWPLPENIKWNYPIEMTRLTDLQDVLYGQFDNPGVYEVKLEAHLGECHDELAKTITIIEGEEKPEGGRLGYEGLVKEFKIYPNPNDGSFDTNIELREESPVEISVWSTVHSIMVGKMSMKGKKSYLQHIDLRGLSSGVYMMRLDHAKGREYLRFIVQH